ncbi:MAG: outer membrane beta-barrel protein [Fluviicola sp.]|nr:outer membrane beta-barrel protein [Fluviicola sp.]
MKFFLTLFTCTASLLHLYGQVKITGEVLTDKNEKSPFTTVLFLSAKDSTTINGCITDDNGLFSIELAANQRIFVYIKSDRYLPYFEEFSVEEKNLHIDSILLKTNPSQLDEVVIKNTVKLIEFKGDKMVMNLSASPVTGGLNAFEMLSKVPGVSTNSQTQTIQLAGKPGVIIMIDGRPTNLSGAELAGMLKSMRSEDFEKVEVISNPSSRYDAEGTSGIINLVTKTSKMYGTKYVLNLGGGYSYYKQFGSYPKHNQGLSVNMKREKLTLYWNVNHSYGTDLNWSDETRNFLTDSGSVFQKQVNTELDKGANNYYSSKFNLDYKFNPRSSLGLSVMGSYFGGHKKANLTQLGFNSIDSVLYDMKTDKRTSDEMIYMFANAHFKHIFDTLGTELSIDLDYIIHDMNSNNQFDRRTASGSSEVLNYNSVSNIGNRDTYIARANFERRFGKRGMITIGYKSKFSFINNTFSSDFTPSNALSRSVFNFYENINAGYIVYGCQIDSLTQLEAGVRVEQTNTLGKDEAGNQLSKQNYTNLFPSFSINRRFTANHVISLGYSRRIGRPESAKFNTFKQFTSALNYSEGNPTLVAALNNTISASMTYKDMYYFEVSYVNRGHYFAEYFDYDSTSLPGYSLVRSSFGNVTGNINWVVLNGYIPIKFHERWSANAQFWTGLNLYNYSIRNAYVNTQQFYWGLSIQNTISLGEGFSLEVSGWISSSETSGFQTNQAMGAIDVAMSKSILKKRGTLKLNFQDPANLYRLNSKFSNSNLTGNGQYRWDNRNFVLNFTYRFGNRNVSIEHWQSKYRDAEVEGK